jgi:hypothetical protein
VTKQNPLHCTLWGEDCIPMESVWGGEELSTGDQRVARAPLRSVACIMEKGGWSAGQNMVHIFAFWVEVWG